jgi:rfaE bifunctional protein nucleotidyltransferase chain/domain
MPVLLKPSTCSRDNMMAHNNIGGGRRVFTLNLGIGWFFTGHCLVIDWLWAGHWFFMGKLVSQEELVQIAARERRSGRRVVFTNGCFDLLHPGHVRCLADARALGDLLIVAVNSDRSVRGNKGSERPLVPEQDRAEVLAALASVDFVTIFDAPTPRELISRVLPNVLVKGADWALDEVAGRAEVEAAGGRVISIPLAPGYSTTSLVEKIRKSAATPPEAAAKRHT